MNKKKIEEKNEEKMKKNQKHEANFFLLRFFSS